jgi:hypothetical protein
MKKLLLMVVVGVMLAGCTLGAPGEDVRPTPVGSSEEPSQWSKEEQAAIDAVDRYLTVWLEISQDLAGQDWNRIYKVASIEIATEDIEQWMIWAEEGYQLFGAPTFTVLEVMPVEATNNDENLLVRMCLNGTESYLGTLDGEPIDPSERGSRLIGDFRVSRQEDRLLRVSGIEDNGETC